jgi:hypothetical protein
MTSYPRSSGASSLPEAATRARSPFPPPAARSRFAARRNRRVCLGAPVAALLRLDPRRMADRDSRGARRSDGGTGACPLGRVATDYSTIDTTPGDCPMTSCSAASSTRAPVSRLRAGLARPAALFRMNAASGFLLCADYRFVRSRSSGLLETGQFAGTFSARVQLMIPPLYQLSYPARAWASLAVRGDGIAIGRSARSAGKPHPDPRRPRSRTGETSLIAVLSRAFGHSRSLRCPIRCRPTVRARDAGRELPSLSAGSCGGGFCVGGLKGALQLESGPDSELGEHVA